MFLSNEMGLSYRKAARDWQVGLVDVVWGQVISQSGLDGQRSQLQEQISSRLGTTGPLTLRAEQGREK